MKPYLLILYTKYEIIFDYFTQDPKMGLYIINVRNNVYIQKCTINSWDLQPSYINLSYNHRFLLEEIFVLPTIIRPKINIRKPDSSMTTHRYLISYIRVHPSRLRAINTEWVQNTITFHLK